MPAIDSAKSAASRPGHIVKAASQQARPAHVIIAYGSHPRASNRLADAAHAAPGSFTCALSVLCVLTIVDPPFCS
jgi:hypothetical protein